VARQHPASTERCQKGDLRTRLEINISAGLAQIDGHDPVRLINTGHVGVGSEILHHGTSFSV